MSQLHFIQFANLALHLSGRAKSLNNTNVFDKVFWNFFCFVLLFLTRFCGLFCNFQMTEYSDEAHTTPVSNPVALDVEIFFKAYFKTQSSAPNLDLYPVRCYSSESNDPDDTGANFTLISNG